MVWQKQSVKIFILYTPFPGIVVQLVRAPPCQGGSCGFEPRQSRWIQIQKKKKDINSFFLFVANKMDKHNFLPNKASPWFFICFDEKGRKFGISSRINVFLFYLVWLKDLPMLYYFMSWFDSSDFVIRDIDPIWYHRNQINTFVERFIISMGLNPEFVLWEI